MESAAAMCALNASLVVDRCRRRGDVDRDDGAELAGVDAPDEAAERDARDTLADAACEPAADADGAARSTRSHVPSSNSGATTSARSLILPAATAMANA